ncbi:MAG: hypothetical protein EXS37_06685 [Opitutus sp.]|nr:hypothetical protein [Opitutus sp.]
MPLSYAELEQFYEGLVARARHRGIPCAITSGMACVAFGVAQATKDCALLCAPDAAGKFLDLLGEASLHGQLPRYRGQLAPPLDARWLRGGWTSHFVWDAAGAEAYLDIFGVAPRGSSPWEAELQGFYAGPNTVAEMKRTNREKDWPFVTALGAQMLEAQDARGWLHIYDETLLRTFGGASPAPADLLKRRPILELAVATDPRLRAALFAEIQFWHELDRARLRVYEKAVRPYLAAVRQVRVIAGAALTVQHEIRVRCAEKHLPTAPLQDYGIERMITEAREALVQLVHPSALAWLPDVREHFKVATT